MTDLDQGSIRKTKGWNIFGKLKHKGKRKKPIEEVPGDKSSICSSIHANISLSDSGIGHMSDAPDRKSILSKDYEEEKIPDEETTEFHEPITVGKVKDSKNVIIGHNNVQIVFKPTIIIQGEDLIQRPDKNIKLEIHLKVDLENGQQIENMVVERILGDVPTRSALSDNRYNASLSDTYHGSIVLLFDVPPSNANDLITDLQNGTFVKWLENALSNLKLDSGHLKLELSHVVFKEDSTATDEQTQPVEDEGIVIAEHSVQFHQSPAAESYTGIKKNTESHEHVEKTETETPRQEKLCSQEEQPTCCILAPLLGCGKSVIRKLNGSYRHTSSPKPNRIDNYNCSTEEKSEPDLDSGVYSFTVSSKASMLRDTVRSLTSIQQQGGATVSRTEPQAGIKRTTGKGRFDVFPVELEEETGPQEYAVIDKKGGEFVGSLEVYENLSP